MGNLPLQSLERANFTKDSDNDESTRRVRVDNGVDEPVPVYSSDQTPEDIRHQEILCALTDIRKELHKMNFYWEMITNTKL